MKLFFLVTTLLFFSFNSFSQVPKPVDNSKAKKEYRHWIFSEFGRPAYQNYCDTGREKDVNCEMQFLDRKSPTCNYSKEKDACVSIKGPDGICASHVTPHLKSLPETLTEAEKQLACSNPLGSGREDKLWWNKSELKNIVVRRPTLGDLLVFDDLIFDVSRGWESFNESYYCDCELESDEPVWVQGFIPEAGGVNQPYQKFNFTCTHKRMECRITCEEVTKWLNPPFSGSLEFKYVEGTLQESNISRISHK